MSWRRRAIYMSVASLTLAIGAVPDYRRPPRQQVDVPDDEQPMQRPALTTPDDAMRLAFADLTANVSPLDWPYTRYVWVQDGDVRSARTTSLMFNYDSRGVTIARPLRIAGGYLLRTDIRQWAPGRLNADGTTDDKDLHDWLHFWEEFAFDPSFSHLVTRDAVEKQVEKTVTRTVLVPGPQRKETRVIHHDGGRYVAPDDSGRVWPDLVAGDYSVDLYFNVAPVEREVTEIVKEVIPEDASVVRFNAAHIDQRTFQQLQELTRSAAPVVEHRYLKSRMLTAIKDRGVFRTVWGGLYYEFRGVKKAKEALGEGTKATDLDLYFDSLGIGSVKGGVTAEQLFDRLRSDQRVAVFRSLVTGKPREVDSFHTPADKEGGSWGAITGDVRDSSVDIGDNPVANLLKPRREAREAIFPTATSFPIFALFNGRGERQDEVPPDIAVDSTIPAPHTRRLQPAIGCIRCHGTDGSDGFKPLVNDVKRLLGAGNIDAIGDFGFGRVGAFDSATTARQVGLFNGDFSKNLKRARDDLAEATLRATDVWTESNTDLKDIHKVATRRLAGEHAAYWYDTVDAHQALREMGEDVSVFRAVETFKRMVPRHPSSLEDPRIGALAAGLSINRTDFSLCYHDIMVRSAPYRKKGLR